MPDRPGDDTAATETRDNPGVIARPPRLYLGFLLAGLLLGYLWPLPVASGTLRYALAAALIGAGLIFVTLGFTALRRAGTNIPPHLPATALVTSGIYRRSRNPLYVALTLFYAGIAVALDQAWALVLLMPLLIVMRYGVVAREERYLERKFGEAYRQYKARVRRWI